MPRPKKTPETLGQMGESYLESRAKHTKTIGVDKFEALYKRENQHRTDALEAMPVPGGALVRNTIASFSPNSSTPTVSQSISFIPNVKIAEDENFGRKLIDANTNLKTSTASERKPKGGESRPQHNNQPNLRTTIPKNKIK